MERIIDILNAAYTKKIEPLQRENEELKREVERYRKIAAKAVKERNILRDRFNVK